MADRFLKAISGLLALAGRNVTQEMIGLYDDFVVKPYGEEAAMRALAQWQTDPKATGGAPMPRDLIRYLAPPVNDRDEANYLAGKMIAAIARRGYTWPGLIRYDGFEDFDQAMLHEFGDARPATIVKNCGGWISFCEQFGDLGNASARAQLRDLLESTAKIAARDQAATKQLSAGNADEMVKQLAAAKSMEPK
jgi:hypothetical protein